MSIPNEWTLLVYRVPAYPTRLRLAIWRRLQKMGAVYLQDAVCLLPARPDLTENLSYVAGAVEEMGGTSYLFSAQSLLPDGAERVAASFRELADAQLRDITARLDGLHTDAARAEDAKTLDRVADELKREKVAYLRAEKIAYFGVSPESEATVEAGFETLNRVLDEQYHGGGK